jgi:hypothetical protein
VKLPARDARFWLIAGAAVAIIVMLAGWTLAINPQRNSAATLRAQAADAKVANGADAARVAALARLNRDSDQLTADLRSVLGALPSDSGLPEFTRQVTAQAVAHDITLKSIGVGGFTVPAGDAAAGTDTSTGAVTDGTDPAVATDSGVPADIVSIPVTLISDGSAADELAFLHAIRVTGPRRALVTSTALAVGATTGATSIEASCTMTVSLTVYSAVRTGAEQAEYAKLLRG